MSENVQFDMDEQGLPPRRMQSPGSFTVAPGQYQYEVQSDLPGMAGWLLRKGIVKTEGGAKNALIAVVVINFVVAGIVVYFFVLK